MTSRFKLAYWVLALVYLLALFVSPFPLEWLPKALPIWLLAVAVGLHRPFRGKWVLLVAVLFGSAGDVLLEVGGFLPGLGAFLVAQVLYAALYARRRMWRPERLAWALYLGVWASAVLLMVWSNLGAMRGPVLAYLVAIMSMGLAAVFSRYALWPGVLGAATFILSDSLIAVGLFVEPLPAHDWAVMLSYYGAQYLIVQSHLLRSVDR